MKQKDQLHCKRLVVGSATHLQIEEVADFYLLYHDRDRHELIHFLRKQDYINVFRSRRLGIVKGFVTMKRFHIQLQGSKAIVIYPGLGVINPTYRGQYIVERTGLKEYLAAKIRHPLTKCYFALTVLSHFGYRKIYRSVSTVWPHPIHKTPKDIQYLIDHAGEYLSAPGRWDSENGIIRGFDSKRLKRSAAALTSSRLADPIVRYFINRNPGYESGDTLLCIARLTLYTALPTFGKPTTS